LPSTKKKIKKGHAAACPTFCACLVFRCRFLDQAAPGTYKAFGVSHLRLVVIGAGRGKRGAITRLEKDFSFLNGDLPTRRATLVMFIIYRNFIYKLVNTTFYQQQLILHDTIIASKRNNSN
jgi:hypothetical protein